MFFHKKILIIDEAESSRRFLRHILTNSGYTAEAVSNNTQAIELISDGNFDIFFVDVSLPELNGIEIIKHLRKIEGYESTPILVITSALTLTDDMIQECGAAGVTDWIAKPISPSKVTSLLKKMDHNRTSIYHAQSIA